jgi:hypothetical protein
MLKSIYGEVFRYQDEKRPSLDVVLDKINDGEYGLVSLHIYTVKERYVENVHYAAVVNDHKLDIKPGKIVLNLDDLTEEEINKFIHLFKDRIKEKKATKYITDKGHVTINDDDMPAEEFDTRMQRAKDKNDGSYWESTGDRPV